ncbi:MAG: AI-2E family transporter [Firmicutes bacterium]|nr:AI-2E family transporter [Bacillota bacterium]
MEKRRQTVWAVEGLVFVLVIALCGVLVLWMARVILLPFVLAFIFAYLVDPLIERMTHRHIKRWLAVLIIYGILGAGFLAVLMHVVPVLVGEAARLIHFTPRLMVTVQRHIDYWMDIYSHVSLPQPVRRIAEEAGRRLQGQSLKAARHILSLLLHLVPGMLSLVVAPILAFYVLVDFPRIKRKIWCVVPILWRPSVYIWGRDIDRSFSGYFRGQMVVATFVGIMSGLWVAVLHIPFAALIGVLSGIMDIVPYIGPIAGALPAVLLGIKISGWTALWAILGFAVIHQTEGIVLAPKIVGESVGLHPLLIIFVLLAGGEIAGLLGVLLAVPVAAAIKITILHGYHILTQGTGVAVELPETKN